MRQNIVRKLVNKIAGQVAFAVTPMEYVGLEEKENNAVYVICNPGKEYDIVWNETKIGTTDGKIMKECMPEQYIPIGQT